MSNCQIKLKRIPCKSSISMSTAMPSLCSELSSPAEVDLNKPVGIQHGCFHVEPGTKSGRRLYWIRMICFPFIPILALFIQNTSIFLQQRATYDQAKYVNQQIIVTVNASRLLNAIQKERSNSIFYLLTNENKTAMEFSFQHTEIIMNIMSRQNWIDDYGEDLKDAIWRNLSLSRKNLMRMNTSEYKQISKFICSYNFLNEHLISRLSKRIGISVGLAKPVWRQLIAYKNLIEALENFSISALISFYFFVNNGTLNNYDFGEFMRHDSLAMDHLMSALHFLKMDSFFDEEVENQLNIYRNTVYNTTVIKKDDPEYEDLMFPGMTDVQKSELAIGFYFFMNDKILAQVKKHQLTIKTEINNTLISDMNDAKFMENFSMGLLVSVVILSTIIIFLVNQTTNTIQSYSRILGERTNQLLLERTKSDRLLGRMLPSPVIKQLKQQRQVPAENFEAVTIFFSDIVGFTFISASSSAMEVVTLLNTLYKIFDSRILKYDVYKVETIGDSYMVASGLPKRNGDKHAQEIAFMSLDLLAGVSTFPIPHRPTEKIKMRVGVNTGPCVAGVVGTTMPRYCLFGDTINLASRMESTGAEMKIHISEHTKNYLDAAGGFHIEKRGETEIKGKGTMSTFWLLGHDSMDLNKLALNEDFTPVIYEPEFLKMI